MTADLIFNIANPLALVGWLLIAVLPRWKFTRLAVLSGAIPLLFAIAYTVLIALFFGRADGGFGSLPDVMRLFTNEWAVLAGWIHYLAFDLFIGCWMVKDAERRGIPHFWVIPCLVFTFLLGPIGFMLYHILRYFLAKEAPDVSETV